MSEEHKNAAAQLERLHTLFASGHAVLLDYPLTPQVRYGHGARLHPKLAWLFASEEGRYAEHLSSFLPFQRQLAAIANMPPSDTREPFWRNDWMPALDAIAIYGFIAARKPRRYVEIGSGMSTKFAARAIRDHGLATKIISIDPQPRSEINALCSEIVRRPLQEIELSPLTELTRDDMLFFDGSHRCFQNSDATVFFTEILPAMREGVLVGVHDIFLPHDYPESWLTCHYSEQYLLACYLLGGEALQVELPAYYCSHRAELHAKLAPLWTNPALTGANHAGGGFWFTTGRFR